MHSLALMVALTVAFIGRVFKKLEPIGEKFGCETPPLQANERKRLYSFQYSIKATWMDDPEYATTISSGENRWDSLKENSENLGLTFAGKAEFPWIVDIRVERKSQDYWSVGNLVKTDTVFTCCRCIQEFGDLRTGTDTPRIYFGQMYLFEYTLRDDPTGQDWLFGGTRFVLEAKKHELCNVQQQYYDGGIITLLNPILPSPPTITLMPISVDYATGKLPDFDLANMAQQRRVCYIASFGRDFANIKDHLVKDFKVKYRVYYEDPQLCRNNQARMCPNRYISDCRIGGSNPNVEGKELMCFQARARVGVVCDHDKGAPLVCDGTVFGLVILGAREDRCNDVLQVPFWVQKASMYRDYFEANREGGARATNRRTKTRSSDDSAFEPNYILLLVPTIVSHWF